MSNRLARFSPMARSILAEAQRYTISFHQSHIDLEHLLLAIVHSDSVVVRRVLKDENVDYQALLQAFSECLGQRFIRAPYRSHIQVASEAFAVIHQCEKIADRFGSYLIEPEHLLFRLLTKNHAKVTLVLEHLGTSSDKLLAELTFWLEEASQHSLDE